MAETGRECGATRRLPEGQVSEGRCDGQGGGSSRGPAGAIRPGAVRSLSSGGPDTSCGNVAMTLRGESVNSSPRHTGALQELAFLACIHLQEVQGCSLVASTQQFLPGQAGRGPKSLGEAISVHIL